MGKISDETLEQIAAANDIVEVIGSYFPLKRAGATWKALCPFHQERSPSFTVNPSRQIFKCFGCGAGGSVFRFVMDYEHVDFGTAVRKLADRAGVRIVEEELSPADDRKFRMRKRLLALHQEAAQWFHRNLVKSPAADGARSYLQSRGITSEVAKGWLLGYAPDTWEAFGNWARESGFTAEEIVNSGLVSTRDAGAESPGEGRGGAGGVGSGSGKSGGSTSPRYYDRFRDRVMFPICNDLGEVIAFSGRLLHSDAKAAKYVNSPETVLFTKGHVLFGLHRSKRALIDAGTAIVLEGQIDLITAFEAGIRNVVAPQGTAFTDKQAHKLKQFVDGVVLCFDADSAGMKATERSLGALLSVNLLVRVAEIPAGHDPDSLIREQGAAAFAGRIAAARDFFDFQMDRHVTAPDFATPHGKAQFARRMAESVSLLTDRVLRENVAAKVASRIGVPAETFARMLDRKAPAAADEVRARLNDRTPISTKAVDVLALVALRDSDARAWLLTRPWDDVLGKIENSGLLAKILAARLSPADPASLAAFTAQLDETEAAVVTMLLEERLLEALLADPASHFPDAKSMAQDVWRELERRELERRREEIKSRLLAPELPFGEVVQLQKQILDLQKRLTDIARPLSPAASDCQPNVG